MQQQNNSQSLFKSALFSGISNGLVTMLINWKSFHQQNEILVTSDFISSTEKTLFASAVPMATMLAFILSGVAYFTLKHKNKPAYFPTVFLMSLRHTVFAFGGITIFALMFQRLAGSIYITPLAGVIYMGLVAAIVSAAITWLVTKEVFRLSGTATL